MLLYFCFFTSDIVCFFFAFFFVALLFVLILLMMFLVFVALLRVRKACHGLAVAQTTIFIQNQFLFIGELLVIMSREEGKTPAYNVDEYQKCLRTREKRTHA